MDLLLPRRCSGCRRPGVILCAECQRVLQQPPQIVTTRLDTYVPVFSLSPWNGPHREIILDMKERNNRAIRPYAGAVLGAAVRTLIMQGHIPPKCVLIPAPTSAARARLRGGDHVSDMCQWSGYPTVSGLRHSGVRDSVGLSARQRRENLNGGIKIHPRLKKISSEVLLVDDVITTGATLAASVEVLVSAGLRVRAALTLSYA